MGAAAVTPHSSSIAFFNSTSSSTVILPSSSSTLEASVAISPTPSRSWRSVGPRGLLAPRRLGLVRAPPRPSSGLPVTGSSVDLLRPPASGFDGRGLLGGLRRGLSAPPRRPSPPPSCSILASSKPTGPGAAPGGGQELRHRRHDHAEQLAPDHVDRRHLRELLDLLARERPALEDPASQREDVRLLRRAASAFATAAGRRRTR